MDERGSLTGSATFLLLLMLTFAAFGVDLSRYFLYNLRIQESSDAAALAGAVALQQYTDDPDETIAVDAVLRHARQNPGRILDPDDQVTVARLEINGDTPYYRVGVMMFGGFDPYFLPKQVFGDEVHPIIRKAVAEVKPGQIGRLGKVPIECSIFIDNQAVFEGNNTKGKNVNVCSNNNVTIESPSDNFELQDVYVYHDDEEEPAYSCTGPHCPDAVRSVYELPEKNAMPSYSPTDPSEYDGAMSDDTWNDEMSVDPSTCSSGNALPGAEWGGTGEAVCVSQDASGETYSIAAPSTNAGLIQKTNGDPYTIHSSKSVAFEGGGSSSNHVGLSGGVYATGNVEVYDNNWDFLGDPNALGGLSVWSAKRTDSDDNEIAGTGTLHTHKNNVRMEGIIGGEEDIIIASEGGGGDPELIGVVASYDNFEFSSNAHDALLKYDQSLFNPDNLEGNPWKTNGYVAQDQPLFASVQATLIE